MKYVCSCQIDLYKLNTDDIIKHVFCHMLADMKLIFHDRIWKTTEICITVVFLCFWMNNHLNHTSPNFMLNCLSIYRCTLIDLKDRISFLATKLGSTYFVDTSIGSNWRGDCFLFWNYFPVFFYSYIINSDKKCHKTHKMWDSGGNGSRNITKSNLTSSNVILGKLICHPQFWLSFFNIFNFPWYKLQHFQFAMLLFHSRWPTIMCHQVAEDTSIVSDQPAYKCLNYILVLPWHHRRHILTERKINKYSICIYFLVHKE